MEDLSEERKEMMRKLVDRDREAIDDFYDAHASEAPMATMKIDWGGPGRGQGKRSGGMIKGSMSSPLYVRTYCCVDLSEFKDDFKDRHEWRILDEANRRWKYYAARKFGLSHWPSMYYAVSPRK